MAIEDEDIRDRENWANVSRFWYTKAADHGPEVGRLYHHLATLARPNTLQQLSLYARSLMSIKIFASARESILTMFDSFLGRSNESSMNSIPHLDSSFNKAHPLLFDRRQQLHSEDMSTGFLEPLDEHIHRSTQKWRDEGAYPMAANLGAFCDDCNASSLLREHLHPNNRVTSSDSHDAMQRKYPLPNPESTRSLEFKSSRTRKSRDGYTQALRYYGDFIQTTNEESVSQMLSPRQSYQTKPKPGDALREALWNTVLAKALLHMGSLISQLGRYYPSKLLAWIMCFHCLPGALAAPTGQLPTMDVQDTSSSNITTALNISAAIAASLLLGYGLKYPRQIRSTSTSSMIGFAGLYTCTRLDESLPPELTQPSAGLYIVSTMLWHRTHYESGGRGDLQIGFTSLLALLLGKLFDLLLGSPPGSVKTIGPPAWTLSALITEKLFDTLLRRDDSIETEAQYTSSAHLNRNLAPRQPDHSSVGGPTSVPRRWNRRPVRVIDRTREHTSRIQAHGILELEGPMRPDLTELETDHGAPSLDPPSSSGTGALRAGHRPRPVTPESQRATPLYSHIHEIP